MLGAFAFEWLLYLGIGLVVSAISKSRWPALAAIVIASLSGLHRYLLVEYLNQLMATAFLVFTVFFFVKFRDYGKRSSLLGAIASALIAAGSHRSTLPILATACWSLLLCQAYARYFAGGGWRRLVFLLAVLLTVLAPLGLVVLSSRAYMPIEVQNNLLLIPEFPLRHSTLPEMILLAVVCPLCFWVYLPRVESGQILTAEIASISIAVFSLIVTLNPFLSSELGFTSLGGRMRVLSFVQLSILIPCLVRGIVNRFDNPKLARLAVSLLGVVVAVFMTWSYLLPVPRGAQRDFLENRARLIAALKEKKGLIEPNSVVVANHGQQFLVSAVTGFRSQQRYPESESGDAVYWLSERVPTTLSDDSMIVLFKDDLGSLTVLVRDDDAWRSRLSNPTLRESLRRGNRHLDIYLASQAQ